MSIPQELLFSRNIISLTYVHYASVGMTSAKFRNTFYSLPLLLVPSLILLLTFLDMYLYLLYHRHADEFSIA